MCYITVSAKKGLRKEGKKRRRRRCKKIDMGTKR